MARFGAGEDPLAAKAARPVPVRTCVGCRGRGPRSELLRVVARIGTDGAVVLSPDPQRRLPGRGAWLHPAAECLHAAERRRAFGRALRVRGTPDARAVAELLGEHLLPGR